MKTRFKHLTKSTVSVLLALMMIISTVTVGIVATNAAFVDSESVGWNTDGSDRLNIKIGSNNWTTFNCNSDGYIDFTISSECTCEWTLFSKHGNTTSEYRRKDSESVPNGLSKDNYYAKYDQGGSYTNFSATLKAGEYVVQFTNHYNDDKTLEYKFWRKSPTVYGAIESTSWSGTQLDMVKSGNAYYYELNGTGNEVRFRFQNELVDYRPSGNTSGAGSGADISNCTNYDSGYQASNSNYQENCFKFSTNTSTQYKIWVQSNRVWLTTTSLVSYTATLSDGGSVGGVKTAIATLSGNSQTTSSATGSITGLASGSTVTITAYPASGKQANITASSGTLSSSVIASSGGTVTLTMPSADVTVTIGYSDATGEAVNDWFLYKGTGEYANPSGMTKLSTQLYKSGDVYYAEITPEELNGSGATSFTTGYYTFAISNSSTSYTGIRPVFNESSGYAVCTTAALLDGASGALAGEKPGEYGIGNTRYSYAMVRINSGSFDKLRVEITSNANTVFSYDTSNKTNYKFGIVNEVQNDFDGYYLAGRITVDNGSGTDIYSGAQAKDFKADSTSLKFTPVDGTDATATQYKFETGKTIAELSTPISVAANDTRPQYFVINDKNRLWGDSSNASSDFFYNTALSKLTTNQMAYSSVANQARTDTELLFELVHTDNEDDGKVVIWLDTSDVSDKKEGGGSMKIWYTVEGSTTPLAGGVTLTASPASQVNTKAMTLTATLTDPLADGVNKDNCTYTFYDGDTALAGTVTKKSNTQATYTFPAPLASGTHNFKVVVTTTATYTPNGGAAKAYRQVSAKTTGTFTDPATYISSDITNGVATATWSQLTNNAVNNIGTKTLSAGQSYTFSLSDEQGFNPLFAKYTIDESKSRYVDISYGQKTVTVDGEAVTIRTYIFTPRVNCSNPTIYVDTEHETVYAVATYNEVGTRTNTFSESKTYRYYFAEVKNHDNGSNNGADPLDGIKNGIKISYWNASSNESGTTGKKNGTPVNQSGAAVTAGTDAHRIYIDQSALIAHTMGATKTDSETFTSGSKQLAFQIYYVDIPVWATSFKFANSSGNGITSAWEVLNPNRVYLLFEWGNSAKVSAAVLDDSLWTNNNTNSTTSQNQAGLYYVDTNLIKYNRGNSNANDATTANAALSTRYNSQSTAYPLYFGNYAAWNQSVYNNGQPGAIYHDFEIRWNLAQRGAPSGVNPNDRKTSGGCSYYASIWNLTGFMMNKAKTNNLGGYTLTNPTNDNTMPLFDYDNLSSAATVYTNKKFPFYKSTYNGITTYSYDSLSDPNRLYNTSTGKYVVEDTVGSYRSLNGLPGYQPFSDQQHSIANEFDINFYMTNTGAMTPTTKINGNDQDIAFNFSGDDDVWVYVDGVKVLDLGGDHMISAGSINFTDMKVYYKTAANTPANVAANNDVGKNTDYSDGYAGLGGAWAYSKDYVYTVDLQDLFDAAGVNFKNTDASVKHKLQMFYVERGQNESNFSVEFNLPQASGLSIKNNVTTNYVNPGLVNAALTAASGDYFVYSIQDALASSANVNTVKGKGGNYANVRPAANSGEISLNFAKPVYPANINAIRNVNGVQYVLAQAGQSAVNAEGYSAPTSTSFVDVGGVNYYLSDENLEGKAADLSGKILQTASGDAQANKLYLLSGQMANFRDSIGGNTKVKVQQYATLGETKDENTLTKYQAVAKNDTGNYYITSYKIEEDNINKELQAQTGYTMLRNNESLTALDTNSGLTDSFYFSSYSSDADRNSPAMTVEYYNDIAVGEIRVEKKLDKIYSTQGTKFRFTVKFANIFGDDENTKNLEEYSGLEYYLFNSADDTPVTDTPQIYDPAVGIILEAGQYAKITGVPVETRFKVTERVTANHSLVQIAKTATKNNGASLNNTSLGIDSSTFYNETLHKNSAGTKLDAFNAMSTSDDNQTVSEDDMTYYVNMIPIVEESIIGSSRKFDTLEHAENGYESISKVVFTNKKEAFSIVFKFFDRLEENDTPSQIKSTATEYSFNLESLDEYTNVFTSEDTLPEGKNVNDFKNFDFKRLIQDKAVEFANSTTNINNLLDNYTMWDDQNAAVTAMKAKTNAKDGGTAYNNSNNIMYHTDYIGQMLTESQASGERWVTYKDKSGKVLADPYGFSQCGKTEVGYDDGDVTRYDAVKSIVVWCFNEPKKYTVNVHHAAADDTMTPTTVTLNGVSKTFYKSGNTGVTTIQAYYNQRLGYALDGYDDVGFFEQYGISGVTGVKPGDYRVNTINENDSPKYQFAYWAYDAAGTQVASTEWHYAYRVTKSIDLYPIYTTIVNPVSVGFGVTAVEDQADRYVDNNGNSKTRLNVIFNPYGLDDNDSNIKKSVILNIIFTDSMLDTLEAKGENNDSAIINLFKDNRAKLATYLNNHASAVMTDAIDDPAFSSYVNRSFMYTMKGNSTASPTDVVVELTNKNRMQFTSIFNTSTLYRAGKEQKILQVTAMKYDDTWIISDNCIVNRFAVAAD